MVETKIPFKTKGIFYSKFCKLHHNTEELSYKTNKGAINPILRRPVL